MTDRGARLPQPEHVLRLSPLIACGPFGDELGAAEVGAAIAGGLRSTAGLEPDVLALPSAAQAQRLLADEHFDARMLRSRALVLVLARLESKRLAGSLTLELATRARQSGVPAYAVTRENRLNQFDARILDLQVVLLATDVRGLRRAGRALAGLL